MTKTKKIEPIIHAALNRKALCGFDKRDPSKWKIMNWWVSPKSKKYKDRVNCKACLKSMKKL